MTSFQSKAKVALSSWPTPIETWNRLSDHLGGPRISVKRDDIGSLALGGNKLRKLEYLLADAMAQHCDVVITAGALQSNHARLTAAAAAKLGLDCHLVLKDEVRGRSAAYAQSGNRFLDNLHGATVQVIDANIAMPDALGECAANYVQAGRKPYLIPIGGSNPIGCLGYVSCAVEIADQLPATDAFTQIYVTSGSAGTHAGLLVGLAHAGLGARLEGVTISRSASGQRPIVEDLVAQTAASIGLDTAGLAEKIHLNESHYLPGYGQPNDGSLEAIALCARLEGVLLDPVYTSKTMAALIADIRSGKLTRDDNVLFIHTGGAPALFVYEEQFDAQGRPISPPA